MKKIRTFFIILMIILLSGCGNSKKQEQNIPTLDDEINVQTPIINPDENTSPTTPTTTQPTTQQILSDLQNSLCSHIQNDFSYNMTIDKFDVELSQTEDKVYTASLNVIAKSTYSVFNWKADIKYIKYDQGWKIDNCLWGDYTYKQINYPDDEQIAGLLHDNNLDKNTQKVNIIYDDEMIIYQAKNQATWSEYAYGDAISLIKWQYDVHDDTWEYSGTETQEGTFTLKEELEGFWELYGDGIITIDNVTQNSFDFLINTRNFETHEIFSVTVTDGNIIWLDDGGTLNITLESIGNISFVDYNNRTLFGKIKINISLPDGYRTNYFVTHDMMMTISVSNEAAFGADVYVAMLYGKDSKMETYYSPGLEYKLNDDGKSYSVVGMGQCRDICVIIPNTYKKLPVTNISSYAFEWETNITSIILPSNLKSIEEYAFEYCLSLESIILQSSELSIDKTAFLACNIVSINIDNIATWCNLKIEPGYSFWDGATLYLNYQEITNFNIPKGVTEIRWGLLNGLLNNITNITIPDSVTSIGNSAFTGCTNITYISIPSSVTSIGYSAFGACNNLIDIYCAIKNKPVGWNDDFINTGATIHWGHSVGTNYTWIEATCTSAQTCSDCGATKGVRKHKFGENNTCILCGVAILENTIIIQNIMENRSKYESFRFYRANVVHSPYNYDELEIANPGIAEIWGDNPTLHLMFILDSVEIDASIGYDTPQNYNYYFDMYYKAQDSDNYEIATLQAWSVYKFNPEGTGDIVYRCKFYDAMYHNMVIDTTYDVKLVVREGDTVLGWAEDSFIWTDSCESFVHYAENNLDIIK